MPKFLIEFHHSSEYEGCVRALDAIQQYGSHLITNADWGCSDGVHTGWLIVDMDNREEARLLVPPQYRADSRIVQLRKFTRDEIQQMKRELESET